MQIGRNAPCPFMKVTASACAANSKPAGWTRCPTCRCWRFCSTTPSPAPIPIRLPTGCWSASGLCPAFWKPRRTSILNSTSKCGQYLVPFFHGEQEEVVYLLCLDAKCKALCCVPVHRGSITVASISVRKIVQTALNQNAASVVLAHNHPSGYALPSQEDLDTTRTLQTALQSVGIVLADHIIVADDDYVSLADDGYLGGSYGL